MLGRDKTYCDTSDNTCHTWALRRWWFSTKRRYIKCIWTFYLYLLHIFRSRPFNPRIYATVHTERWTMPW